MKEEVLKAKKKMMRRFDCDEVRPLQEYIGCKVDYNPDERGLCAGLQS